MLLYFFIYYLRYFTILNSFLLNIIVSIYKMIKDLFINESLICTDPESATDAS